MTLQMCLGFDDTIPEASLSPVGGTSGATGRSGRGLAARRSGTGLSTFVNMPTALSTLYMGVGIKTGASLAANRLLGFLAPDGSTLHVQVGMDATGRVTIYGPANTVVATSASVVLTTATWYYFEVKVVVHDTTGSVEVRVGEAVVVSYSGDTRNGAATAVQFMSNAAPASSVDFDDLYVEDAAYLGDVTVESLSPTGNGSSSGWGGSDGNSTDNYLLVDDPTTSNVTDYVGASASGTLDLYTMGDLPAGYSVIAIQEVIYAQKSDAGTAPTLLPVAKGQSGTTRTDTALPALSTTAQAYVGDLRTTDPDGNALTAARVNAMEVGVKIS